MTYFTSLETGTGEHVVLVSTVSGLKSIPTLSVPHFPTVTNSAQIRA